jgi:carboxylesterase
VTVILIHGFTGSPSEMQLLAASLNAEGYGVEVPLLVGHGTNLNELMGVYPQQWLDPLDALITRLLSEGQSVVLGGLSLGSILSLQLALRYPQIKALLLYSPPVRSGDPRRFLAPLFIRFTQTLPKPASDFFDPIAAERLWSYDRYPVATSARVLDLISRTRKQLSEVQQPLLAIASRRDKVISHSGIELLMRTVQSSPRELHWLERSSHSITVDAEWTVVRDLSLEFLRKIFSTQS